jgi:hypothetical protein
MINSQEVSGQSSASTAHKAAPFMNNNGSQNSIPGLKNMKPTQTNVGGGGFVTHYGGAGFFSGSVNQKRLSNSNASGNAGTHFIYGGPQQ